MKNKINNKNFERALKRLDSLDAEQQVRRCMHKYMSLCDNLDVGFELSKLTSLFAKDAVWQGKGKRYTKTFGRYESRKDISKMFSKYVKAPAHFKMNAHFLCNELIEVNLARGKASGVWMLIQPSTFSSGKSQLSCARITAEFVFENDVCLISKFTTQNIFSRPMAEPWDNPAPLAVPVAAPKAKKTTKKKVSKKKPAAKKKATRKKLSKKSKVKKK